ncbi:MAG: glycosyltransferase family 39 protein [Bacteroidetes bacterium]|nr:glycosyltransferase family 39 protein [Bacteroidota bacterium]
MRLLLKKHISAASTKEKLLRILLFGIILGGIVLRITLWVKNRDLIIDEANIVRNLAERDFAGLARPLSYEQFAPPIFLWIEKIASLLFGYGERAMRLFPLLCGIAALFIYFKVSTKLFIQAAIWLPLSQFAFSRIFVEYSTVVKQYMPDALTALLLLWAALSWKQELMSRRRFVGLWIIVGSIAIWSSMPSVFVLSGVGAYYFWPHIQSRSWKKSLPILLIGVVWLIQFGIYYEVILKAQINSSYLQNYHKEYFLFLVPKNGTEWGHNADRIIDLLGNIGGFSTVAIVACFAFILIGATVLLLRNMQQFLLIVLPVILVLLAAGLKQFSLIDRVVLFAMPITTLIIAAGFEFLWKTTKGVRIFLAVLGCFMIYIYNGFWILRRGINFHEITKGMAWLRDVKHAKGEQLFVHDANVATYIYYTELHPNKAQWASLLGAHRLTWDTNYSLLTQHWKDTAYFLYTGGFGEAERQRRTRELEQNMRQLDYFEKYICYVYEYVPKTTQTNSVTSGATPN